MTDSDTKHSATSQSQLTTLTAGSSVGGKFLRLQQRVAAIAPDARSVRGVKWTQRWAQKTAFASTSLTVAGGQQVATTLHRWVTRSWGYQWLTAEPDPEVIIIDLRDTVAIGPVIRLLDWLTPRSVRTMRNSTSYQQLSKLTTTVQTAPLRIVGTVLLSIALLQLFVGAVTGSAGASDRFMWLAVAAAGLYGLRETRSWDDLQASRVVEATKAVLEPPASPEKESKEKATAAFAAESELETEDERKSRGG